MKILNKTNLILILTISLASCNKESLIEGTNTKPTVTVINITNSLYASSAASRPIVLSIDGGGVQFNVTNYLTRGFTTNVNTASDSMRYHQMPGFYSNGVITMRFAYTSGAVTKYAKGASLPTSILTPQSFLIIGVEKRISPYTTNYASITTSISGSPFGSAAFTPQFTLNSEGYIGFIYTNNINGVLVNYYGWLHVIIDQNNITFDKYAYQAGTPLTAGQED